MERSKEIILFYAQYDIIKKEKIYFVIKIIINCSFLGASLRIRELCLQIRQVSLIYNNELTSVWRSKECKRGKEREIKEIEEEKKREIKERRSEREEKIYIYIYI